MKYFVKCLLLIVASSLSYQTLFAQQRNVVFFYGLNKKATESEAYANTFESSRSITSVFETFNYATQQTDPQGMIKVAQDARTQATTALNALSSTAVSDPRNVALGHDVGGLIARQISKTHSNMFGGIILTGTPNTEMPLVSNYMNGRLFSDFKHIGLTRAGDVKASFKLGAQDFGMIPIAEIPMKWAEKTFGADPAAIFRSVNDLQKDSRFLRNLGNPTVPTVAIWGNENDPAIWRFFSSVNSAAIGATPLVTTDRSDGSLVTLVNAAADAANATLNSENRWGIFKVIVAVTVFVTATIAFAGSAVIIDGVLKFIGGVGATGTGIAAAIPNFDNAAKARSARDWLEIDCRTIWNNLIGATRDDIVTIDNRGAMTESCRQGINDPARGWGWYYGILTSEERERCWINEITQVLVRVQEESDGILHKTTQQLGIVLPARARVEARGANHEELLNHTAVTTAYNDVWLGRVDVFFTTP